MSETFIHPTAVVAPSARIGRGTKVWMNAQVREEAQVGSDCIIGKDAYVDFQVVIGDRCKIQNGALLYHATTLEEGVFIGPGAILTNDRVPRALTREGNLAGAADWQSGHIQIGRGASIGAGAILLTDLKIGEYALVGAGAVVTRDVPPHALVVGNPARRVGYVCACGHRLVEQGTLWVCERDGSQYQQAADGGLAAVTSRIPA